MLGRLIKILPPPRFKDMFQDKELWLAAISNPKLIWLEDDADVSKATTLFKSAFKRNKDNVDDDFDM